MIQAKKILAGLTAGVMLLLCLVGIPLTGMTEITAEAATSTDSDNMGDTDESAFLLGDLDNDDEITISDAALCLQAYANAAAGNDDGLTEEQAAYADLNGDGTITINEAYYILEYYAFTAAIGESPSWDDIIGDCTYTTGSGVITIGTGEVGIDDLKANDYQYEVEIPVTSSGSGLMLAFGLSLDEALSLNGKGYSTDAAVSTIPEGSDMYWFALIDAAGYAGYATLNLTLTVPEDVAVGDTFAITGQLTAPDGSPAIIDGETAAEIVSGSVTVVEGGSSRSASTSVSSFGGTSAIIAIDENTIAFETIEVTLDELESSDYIVSYQSCAGYVSSLAFGFSLDDGLSFIGRTTLAAISACPTSASNKYYYAAADSNGLAGFFTFYFQVPDDAMVGDVYTITLYDTWSDGSTPVINNKSATAFSGSITIVEEKSQTTTTTTTKTDDAAENSATTTTTTTTSAVTDDTDTDESTFLLGDLDGNGEITISDAALCLQAYANAAAGNDDGLTEEQRKAADVDENGEVTINDASYILQYYANNAAGNSVTWADILA